MKKPFVIFQMIQSRLLKSQLIRKLKDLQKTHAFPEKPNLHPAILYVEDVLNQENLKWDQPQRRGFNLNNAVRTAMSSWSEMPSIVKDAFEKDAESLRMQHEEAEQGWHEIHGDMDYAFEIKDLQKQIDSLK